MKAMERRLVREPEPSVLRRLAKLLFWGSSLRLEALGDREGLSKPTGEREGRLSKPLGDREGAFSKELVRSGLSLHHVLCYI